MKVVKSSGSWDFTLVEGREPDKKYFRVKLGCFSNYKLDFLYIHDYPIELYSENMDITDKDLTFILPNWFSKKSTEYLLKESWTAIKINSQVNNFSNTELIWLINMCSSEELYYSLIKDGYSNNQALLHMPCCLRTNVELISKNPFNVATFLSEIILNNEQKSEWSYDVLKSLIIDIRRKIPKIVDEAEILEEKTLSDISYKHELSNLDKYINEI